MNCMRCGREIKEEDSNVFCPACRTEMDGNPVPPGTPIHLPSRQKEDPVKKRHFYRKKEQKPEDQIARLRHANRWLAFALIITVLAFAFTAFLLIYTLNEPDVPLGRNFGVVQSSTESDCFT